VVINGIGAVALRFGVSVNQSPEFGPFGVQLEKEIDSATHDMEGVAIAVGEIFGCIDVRLIGGEIAGINLLECVDNCSKVTA
jgi:hypothetical protein